MGFRAVLFHAVATLSRSQKKAVFLAVDTSLTAIAASFLLFTPSDFLAVETAMFLCLLAVFSAATSAYLGLPRIKLNAYGRHSAGVTAKFAAFNMLWLTALSQTLQMPINAFVAAEFGVLLFLACVGSRYAMLNGLLWVLRRGKTVQRVLIYGAGDTGVHMALALRNHPWIRPIAFVDDDVALQRLSIAGLQVINPAQLEIALQGLSIDLVLLAMPSTSASRIAQITRRLMALGLDVQKLTPLGHLPATETPPTGMATENPQILLGRSEVTEDLPSIGTAYRGRVVLVSGAGGSVGAELCRQLIKLHPKALVLYERSEIALYAIDRELRESAQAQDIQIIPVLGSVTDGRLAHRTMVDTGTDVVLHAAAYKHLPLVEVNPVAGLANNVLGTQIFAQAAKSAGVGRFLLISTDKAVRPTSAMGATKRFAELVVRDFANWPSATQFSTVRFGNVLGSSGSVLPLFRDQIKRGGPITLTHEDVTRYFMSIAEAARLVLISGSLRSFGSGGSIFVLDMGKPLKIKSIAERMIRAEGLTVKTRDNPSGDIEIVVTGLRSGEKLHEELFFDGPMLTTPHPKILRTQGLGVPEKALSAALRAAEVAVQAGDQRAARAVLDLWIDASVPAGGDKPNTANLREAAFLSGYGGANGIVQKKRVADTQTPGVDSKTLNKRAETHYSAVSATIC
jgi:FlaA1/EpsC-like NDP-sugar epimerase